MEIKYVILLLLIIQTKSESRTVNSKLKFSKVISKKEVPSDLKLASIDNPKKCDELSPVLLNEILGAAFNSRYMSIEEPKIEEDLEQKNIAGKRGADDFIPFYVDDTYAMEISDMPAWEVQHLSENSTEFKNRKVNVNEQAKTESQNKRVQRSSYRRRADIGNESNNGFTQSKRPWECEAKIKWLDLGYDYYPRYLRTVECTRHSCFYGHFTCKPRSFTVKILRRRRGECVQTRNKIGIDGLHGDLKELWVWEERAVNFCCDCAAN